MKCSALIKTLQTVQALNGDLDVIHRVGELSDPEAIHDIEIVNADKSGPEDHPFYYIPWDNTGRTNVRVVELT